MTRIAVIGFGAWGPNHVRNFIGLCGLSNVIAVDRDEQRRSHALTRFPGIRVESDARAVLDDPTIDAVCIATPTSTHYELTRDSLKAGKHVLCEKPLTETAGEAEELVRLARIRQRALMVGFVFLYNSGIRALRKLIADGELGSLHYLSAVRTNLGPIRSDVNAAFDLAAHDVSIFNWLLNGEPEVVSAVGGAFLQEGIEDVTFISLRYPNNIIAHIHASWLNPQKIRKITVVGSSKMVTWDDLELTTPIAIYDKGAYKTPDADDFGQFLRLAMWDNEIRLPKIQLDEPLKVQDQAFLEAISNDPSSLPDGEMAAGVGRVLDAATRSLQQNGTPIRLTDPLR